MKKMVFKKMIVKSMLIATISCMAGTKTIAQTATESIKSTFPAFDTAKTYSQRMPLATQLKLIASKWPNEWLANYYAAYALIELSFDEKDKNKEDAILDEAEIYFRKIEPLAKTNEEISILGAYLASARISAKPSAYKKYGDIREEYLDAAKKMNPNNPRIYLIEANSAYYKPKMFGGGPKKALLLYEKAASLFNAEDKSNVAKPYWGTIYNNHMLNQCKEDLK